MIELDATGKATSLDDARLDTLFAGLDRPSDVLVRYSKDTPRGQERRDRARSGHWLSRVDRSLLMLLTGQRREPLVELALGQESVVARDQRAGVAREQLAALHGIAEREAVEPRPR